MSSPHLESLFTIPEVTDDLWPLIQENNSNLVLELGMFQCQEGGNTGKELLAENRNVHQKDDKNDGNFSTSIQAVDHQWPFPRGSSSSSSPPIMDNGNGDKLDSILILEQEISAVLSDYNIDKALIQKESESTGLLPPFSASDYAAGSLLRVSSTLLSIGDNARTDEHDSSTFTLEPVDPNIEEGLFKSILNYTTEDDSLSAPPEDLDEIDFLLQESSSPKFPGTDEKTRDINDQTDFSSVPEKESSALAEPSSGKGSTAKRVSAKTRGRNYRFKKGSQTENKNVQSDKGEGITTMKKQEHNAKERIRRMKLHASYLALGALLPDSSRSMKRKSAPLIIDRAVEYIPDLEEEIEELTLKKNEMLSTIKNKQPAVNLQLQDPYVSVHEIKQGDFIVQIYCTQKDGAFSNLLQKVEEEEEERMCIMSASTLRVSDHGLCYHLHLQMNESLDGENHLSSLREKVISWLC